MMNNTDPTWTAKRGQAFAAFKAGKFTAADLHMALIVIKREQRDAEEAAR